MLFQSIVKLYGLPFLTHSQEKYVEMSFILNLGFGYKISLKVHLHYLQRVSNGDSPSKCHGIFLFWTRTHYFDFDLKDFSRRQYTQINQ